LKIFIFLSFFLLSLPSAQDFSGYDAYDDSISAAKKTILQTQQPDTLKDTSCTRLVDSAKIDSFEIVISKFDSAWNVYERLHGRDSTGERIAALNFYLSKSVMTKEEVGKCAQLCFNQKLTEYDGTRYLIEHECGTAQVTANAHLKKVQMELKLISDYIYHLNKTPIHPQTDHEINRALLIKPVKHQ
jgi:hypothetical protein